MVDFAGLYKMLQTAAIGSLSSDDGNGNENVTWKYNFIQLCYILRDYFNSLNFYKSGELSRNQIGRSLWRPSQERK